MPAFLASLPERNAGSIKGSAPADVSILAAIRITATGNQASSAWSATAPPRLRPYVILRT